MNTQLQAHALTPYFYPVITVSPTTCTEEPSPNYKEYNLFCLKTRLRPFINRHLGPRYSLGFVPIVRGQRVYMGVRLTDAGEEVLLTSRQTRLLEEKVKESTTVDVNACILFSGDVDIYLQRPSCSPRLPRGWILSILPYLPIDRIVNPYVDDQHLYVDLSIYSDYNIRYNKMYDEIEESLRQYYLLGAVACNATFAEVWQLAPNVLYGREEISNEGELLEDEADVQLTDGYGIYIPTWEDVRFAPDRVSFLMERMAGITRVKIRITPTQGKKAAIAKYLNTDKHDFLFDGDYLYIEEIATLSKIREVVNIIANLEPLNLTISNPVLYSPLELGQGLGWKERHDQNIIAVEEDE